MVIVALGMDQRTSSQTQVCAPTIEDAVDLASH